MALGQISSGIKKIKHKILNTHTHTHTTKWYRVVYDCNVQLIHSQSTHSLTLELELYGTDPSVPVGAWFLPERNSTSSTSQSMTT